MDVGALTNPSGHPREYQVILYRRDTAGTITYRGDNSSRVMDYRLKWIENHAKEFIVILSNQDTTSTVNLLNASCAQWSEGVTGSLEMGDKVQFGLYQSDGETVDVLFKGIITDIENLNGGGLQLTAYDYMKTLDYKRPSYIQYANVRDRRPFQTTSSGGRIYLSGVTDSDISLPLVEVSYANQDSRLCLGGGKGSPNNSYDYNIATSSAYWVAQSFIAEGDAFLGVRFPLIVDDDYWEGDIYEGFDVGVTVDLCADLNNSPGSVIASKEATYHHAGDWEQNPGLDTYDFEISFVSSNLPVSLQAGQKYWLKFYRNITPGGATPEAYIGKDTKEAYYKNGAFKYNYSGGSGTDADEFLSLDIDFGIYSAIEPEDYAYDSINGQVIILTDLEEVGVDDYYGSYYRGRASYYYGTITLETVFEKLVRQSGNMLEAVSTNCDRTIKTFSPRGRAAGDIMRELCDLFETSGTWDGYQHVMAHYTDGSNVERCKVGKRLKTTDTSAYTLANPADLADSDDTYIIIGEPRLRKTNKFRHAKVQVIGTDQEGTPIPLERHDRASSGSLYQKMEGMVETLVQHEDSMSNVTDLEAKAFQLLGAKTRDTWEGEIDLSGQHLLWDWDTTSDTYGSGKIITLRWYPLGIDDEHFKVKEVELGPTTTSITLTNIDERTLSHYTRGFLEKIEGEVSPYGYPTVVYGGSFVNAQIQETVPGTIYMELKDSTNTLLTGLTRVLCTVTTDTATNLKVIRGEFPKHNGYSANLVRYVGLYDSSTGGTAIVTTDLYRTVSSIEIDEQFSKLKGTKAIVEITCQAS